MQYFFTPGGDQFLGDCMPFWDGERFHHYSLLDEGHHQGRGGLGGHQWAHAATRACFGHRGAIALAQERLDGARPFDAPFTLEVVMTGHIIDVCVDGRRCLVNRLPERRGDALFLFCEQGAVTFEDLAVRALRADGAPEV